MHIAYICSPDRKLELYSSLHSLLVSGTVFDRLTLLIVSDTRLKWQQFKDKRIKIERVADIGHEFWMINKAHLCNIQDDDILFIDTDTIILKPLNMLGSNAIGDIVGRTTSYYEHPKWPEQAWREYLSRFGATGFFPYLNSGLLLFRNGVHRQLAEPWKKITWALLVDSNFPFGARSHANQLAFSLAVGSLGLSYGLLTPTEHAYGRANEPSLG